MPYELNILATPQRRTNSLRLKGPWTHPLCRKTALNKSRCFRPKLRQARKNRANPTYRRNTPQYAPPPKTSIGVVFPTVLWQKFNMLNFPQEYEFPDEHGLSDSSRVASLQTSLSDLFA
jgi:hypothetical protein